MDLGKINRKLSARFGGAVSAALSDGCIVLTGRLPAWGQVVEACQLAAKKYSTVHVVNDIVCDEAVPQAMRLPSLRDSALEGRRPDVLIIGGGISGASIARELSKWKLDILLVEKEADLALQASGRNDGEVHPGVDLSKGSLKHRYIRKGNAMYDQVCRELDVPFRRVGQYVCFDKGWMRPFIALYCLWRRKHDGIEDTRIISGAELKRREPDLNRDFKFAVSNPSSGCVCPYGLTIAYGENAVRNGAQVSLSTAVLSMEVEDGEIRSVHTNRGTVYPALVINAAGVFAEDVARMAGDRFFSIHPRRGTNSILDKKAGARFSSIASIMELARTRGHSKGGGVLHTAHGNLLVGPDAVETFEKENTATRPQSIDTVFAKQERTMPTLSRGDIITYFTGVRAPTFEEDFIIEKGRNTKNIIHCAGIQSPGLTTAPAVALDIEKMAVEELRKKKTVVPNERYSPIRHGVPVLREMPDEERAELIRKNPDYGVIVCRCEEVSRGEILDALRAPICVPTVDGVKKRVRPGMGRCQGGFCSPLVAQIIAEFLNVPLDQVKKSARRPTSPLGGPNEEETAMRAYDVTVIGGGPAGLAAALSARENGAKTLLIEREARLGGILKQCIHDGFGLVRFQEKLTGPEYAQRFIDQVERGDIDVSTLTFVTRLERAQAGFAVTVVNRESVETIMTRTLVLATGCRERTAKQVSIHGTHPAGVFTAGTAQHFTNLLGQLPTRRCVILGSGDIGLIMARRLTLEGAKVLGVYEAKPTPSGLTRNIHQCLRDYDIPLHLSHTVTRVLGEDRLTAVETAQVDEAMRPIPGTEEIVECDGLILSVGLIPENELAQSLGVELDPRTKGPVCNGQLMTSVDGVFSCGNALHVNDLVDYVSESGELAGRSAARYAPAPRREVELHPSPSLLYAVPQRLDLNRDNSKTTLYFRSREVLDQCVLRLRLDGEEVFSRRYPFLRPPEMERLDVDFTRFGLNENSRLELEIEVTRHE